ncbi:MAG: 3-dehydroquinate synthase [Bacteroidota bacterium]
MKAIQQQFTVPFSYTVHFTEGLFDLGNPLLTDSLTEEGTREQVKAYIAIDDGVVAAHPHLLSDILTYFSQDGISLLGAPLIVPGGERVKNEISWVEKILEEVNTFKIDRHAYIIGIGGGAVLDAVGYAASIAHRGVRHIRIPTTVLSQNDSGVGVKNGINYFGKKNFVGNFAPPFTVINDFGFLKTLDDRDWRSGISEAIKVALLKDKRFYQQLVADAEALANREMAPMKTLIHRCAELHMEHIAGGDPFEMGSSRPLDFGHWAAHKLEQLTDFAIRHGEAVAIGISLDVCYSFFQGMITEEEKNQVLALFTALGFELFAEELLAEVAEVPVLLKGLEEFREHLGGQLTIMLLEGIGKGKEVHEMEGDKILAAIYMLREYQQQLATTPIPQ